MPVPAYLKEAQLLARVSVLIPTYERPESLAATLAGVASQTVADLHVVVSSQGRHRAEDSAVARAMARVISSRGGSVEWHHREPRGIAGQRHFILGRAAGSEAVLFPDDDVFIEPFVVQRLFSVLKSDGCGFVGAFPAGLTFAQDVRPDRQEIQFWEGPGEPEVVEFEGRNRERWQLHRAANLHHVAKELALPPGGFLRYKADPMVVRPLRPKEVLRGRRLLVPGPPAALPHRRGRRRPEPACVATATAGSPPSGTYHAEVETTTFSPAGAVEADALDLLPELVEAVRAEDCPISVR